MTTCNELFLSFVTGFPRPIIKLNADWLHVLAVQIFFAAIGLSTCQLLRFFLRLIPFCDVVEEHGAMEERCFLIVGAID